MLKGSRLVAQSAATLSVMALGCMAVVSTGSHAASGSGCPNCAELARPHKPFRVHGNTYFVGTEGLSAILVTSEYGHVLIDAGLPGTASIIRENIESLGFKLTDIKAIFHSNARPEYVGGVAELQRLSGAQVYALRAAEPVLRTGKLPVDDPLFGDKSATITPVSQVWVLQDEQLVGVGSVRLRVLATPGQTAGGASWTWESCEGGNCLNFVYAADLSASGAAGYRFKSHPDVLQSFESSFRRLEQVSCDVVLTARPEASQLFQRLDPQGGAHAADIKDGKGCARYAGSAREALAKVMAGGR